MSEILNKLDEEKVVITISADIRKFNNPARASRIQSSRHQINYKAAQE
ncbi:MAG TPA: hypothetical protein VE130_03165 [Nitrososphaeraceae archaeon]|jgi:hypothetical protein|nr:hypothetical protein [Nitrososphaeraceae archaeon]